MMFRIENVGPLREAEVDLSKRLIVLAGPNNTGKTYLAWNVYGLHRMARRLSEVFSRWAQALLKAPDFRIDIGELFARDQDEILGELASEYLGQMHQCFAAERGKFDGAKLALSMRRDQLLVHLTDPQVSIFYYPSDEEFVITFYQLVSQSIQYEFALVRDSRGIFLEQLRSSPQAAESPASDLVNKAKSITSPEQTAAVLAAAPSDVAERVQRLVAASLARTTLGAILSNCVLFPAERIAVNIFAKELALGRTKLVDELVDASLEGRREVSLDTIRSRVGSYPWPIRDSVITANDLTRISRVETSFLDLAIDMENGVLGGRVSVSEQGGMLFTPSEASNQQLEVHLTASVVKSLSSLVFYFRHQASQGDFLIIDEPELNLHPDNQRKVARILAKAVRRGFKIMMSTHSDYLIRELSHMIMLSKLPAEGARDLGYDPECALDPEQVGVYLFNEHTAKPVPVDDTGFSVQTIDDAINAMNVDAQRLYARVVG